MASTSVLLLQLLLVSLAAASHFFGGSSTFTYKGENRDGTLRVDIRNRNTFDGCDHSLYWTCYQGNCGYVRRIQTAVTDNSTNAPLYNRQWCETETVSTRNVASDKPFQMGAASCCWVQKRDGSNPNWRLLTSLDLGSRSDTGKPNRSPDIAILPLLRVPQNCPRTYKLMAFDPDGDKVRCRYGNINDLECDSCHQPQGFALDQGSCTLHYQTSTADPRVFGFELMVEDFPQRPITLAYTDGSQSARAPLVVRHKRQAITRSPGWATTNAPTTAPWWYTTLWWPTTTYPPKTTSTYPTTTTTYPPMTTSTYPTTTTTYPPTTTTSTYRTTTTQYPTTTTPYTTTTSPYPKTTTPYLTTTTQYPRTTAPPITTTQYPTTTTQYPTTTTQYRTTTTPYRTTTTAPPTTTTAAPTTTPLSKLPLQFSFLVDPPAPSCQEGHYLPEFVYPTPLNGARIQAEVNKEVEIIVKAQATYATIHDIIISGPINITKQRNTHGEFIISWTPIEDDLGDFFPICFAVESVIGSAVTATTQQLHNHNTPSSQSGIYQSEMRCVLVEVRKKQINSNVICTESTMTVEVEKASFSGLHEDHLRLNDATNIACRLQSNSTHVFAVIPLNGCGTEIEEDDDNLKFKNEITTFDNITYVITRKHLLEVQFYCQYSKRGNVTQSFTAHRNNVTVWDRGFGMFTYQFEFYPNDQYQTMVDPNSYPLVYDLGNPIYMQIEATSSINNTVLFVESCRATPYDNKNYQQTYSIIENGCIVDPTVQTHSPSHQRQFRFSMEAFKFIGMYDQVYISCNVLICEAGSPDTRCSQGCINSTKTSGWTHHHNRRKREAVAQSSRHFVSQGPLRLKRSAESNESSALHLNLNLVFIAGCLLAAVGMISAVAMYKANVSKVKYQPLPTFES